MHEKIVIWIHFSSVLGATWLQNKWENSQYKYGYDDLMANIIATWVKLIIHSKIKYSFKIKLLGYKKAKWLKIQLNATSDKYNK